MTHHQGDRWQDHAACATTDPEAFHPRNEHPWSEPVRAAKRICATCPVTVDCLAFALATEPWAYRYGIYGGLTGRERSRMRRERRTS